MGEFDASDETGALLESAIICFVGTDTGVGKTEATASFLRFLRAKNIPAAATKPFVSGRENGRWHDLDVLDVPVGDRTPACYSEPLSPYGAIRKGEPHVEVSAVEEYMDRFIKRRGWKLIEGIGGVMVPLERGLTWLDWHARWKWPSVVIARAGLGTLNHSILTVEALRSRGIEVAGLILNSVESVLRHVADENAAILGEFLGVETLGVVEYSGTDRRKNWDLAGLWGRLEEKLCRIQT